MRNRKPPWHVIASVVAGIIVATLVFEFNAAGPAFVLALCGWCYVLTLWLRTKLNP